MQKLFPVLSLSILALTAGCQGTTMEDMVYVLSAQDIVEVDIAGVTTYPTVDLVVGLDAGDSASLTPPEFHMTDMIIAYDFGDPEIKMPRLGLGTQLDLEDGDVVDLTVYAALSPQIEYMIENYGVDGALEGGSANISLQGTDGNGDEWQLDGVDNFLITFRDFIDQ